MANCRRYGHMGHPWVGAPRSHGQYVSRPSMRKVAQTDLLTAARGMHGWLASSPRARQPKRSRGRLPVGGQTDSQGRPLPRIGQRLGRPKARPQWQPRALRCCRGEGQQGACLHWASPGAGHQQTPPHQGGHTGPGTGHKRASEEEPKAFGEGLSLAAGTKGGQA